MSKVRHDDVCAKKFKNQITTTSSKQSEEEGGWKSQVLTIV
jgi:hypothetical protein